MCDVIVLGAGRGTRMGHAKVTMDVEGTPWWTLQQSWFERCGVDPIWVLSPTISIPAPRTTSASGAMIDSVRAGFALVHSEEVFILPVDIPAPRPDVWDALRGHDVAIPVSGEARGHPVCCRTAWLEARLGRAERLDAIIRPHASPVAVEDARPFLNLNTPDDLRTFVDSPDFVTF